MSERRTEGPAGGRGRNDLAVQVAQFRAWVTARPIAAFLILALAAGGVTSLFNPNKPITPEQLGVGDCLEVRAPGPQPSDPIQRLVVGPEDAERFVMTGAGVLTSCAAPHTHEVSVVAAMPDRPPTPSPEAWRATMAATCATAFEVYVGGPVEGSRYVTFPAMPVGPQLTTGLPVAVCLVARVDGRWLLSTARNSRQ